MPQQPQGWTPVAEPSGWTPVAADTPNTGGVSGFAEQFWKRANPMEWVRGLVNAAQAPLDGTISGLLPNAVKMIEADPVFLSQAKEAAEKGDYLTAARKVFSFMSMGLGHELDTQEELMKQGRYAEGTGAMLGTATSFLAPEGAAKALGAASRLGSLTPANPAVREAVAFGQRSGVPLDAATATDNAAVRAVQHIADRSLGGAQVAGKAAQRQAEGLATIGEQLAAKAHPQAVTAEQAGNTVREGVLGQIRQHAGTADEAYSALRAIEADPAHASEIYPESTVPAANAPFQFVARPKAKPNEIFIGAMQDARRQGYRGTAAELKAAFDDKLASAKRLQEETNGANTEYGHDAFLQSVRDLGGLKPFEKHYIPGAPAQKLTGEFDNLKQLFGAQRGKNAILRNDGLGLDDLAGQLRQDPRWRELLTGDGEQLKTILEEIGTAKREGTSGGAVDLQNALRGAGVQPGVKWWEPTPPAKTVNLAVDLRSSKAALQPVYDDLKRQAELTPAAMMGDKARTLNALDKLMTGPDDAPLSVVDAALGDLKAFARADIPELRTAGQGIAAGAIKRLDAVVRQRAAEAGPEAIRALETGRQATIAKYASANVLDAVDRGGAVNTTARLTAPKDSAIEDLRSVAQQTPAAIPQIARSVLDGMLEKATERNAFDHADRLWTDWNRIGQGTKAILFKDPAYLKDLDNFFLLAKQTAKNANPSGTAHISATIGQGSLVAVNPLAFVGSIAGGAGVSAFLRSSAGVRLLTQGFRLPPSLAARTAWINQVKAFVAAHRGELAVGQGAIAAQSASGGSGQ